MHILSIDCGFERTGYAVFDAKYRSDEINIVTSGVIRTSKKDLMERRLFNVYMNINKLIKKYRIDILVLEQLFFFRNQKTVIQVSQSQGVLLLLAAQHNIPVEFLTPLQIKQIITGYGNSDKKAVQKMLKLVYNITIPRSKDDEADAIACGLAYCHLDKNLVK